MTDYLKAGLCRARRELALADDAPLLPAEAGVAIKYALAALLAERYGGIDIVRRQARLPELRGEATAALAGLLAALPEAGHLARPDLQARLVDLAIDALLSERLAPEVLLEPAPCTVAGTPHALIFSAFTHCTHELYPLLVDALTAGVTAVGAHESWVEEGRLRRGILLDVERDRLLEVDFDPPVATATAQVLALDLTREAESHQCIERALAGVPLTNPAAGARRLDDKAWTCATWAAAGLDTPAFLAIAAGAGEAHWQSALADWLAAQSPRVVIKPADGTEGRGVAVCDFSQADDRAHGIAHLKRLLARGPVLVMVERGSARFDAGTPVRVTVRLNVCWDGRRAWAESGCAQAAASPDGIASAGRDGHVLPLADAWPRLLTGDGLPADTTVEAWQDLLRSAEAGTAALAAALGPAMPRLVGIDLLLDAGERGALHPVLLEANPRPAGMSHACYVTTAGPDREPGVTQRLWTALPP